MAHPANKLDLTPSDYYLFWSIANLMRSRRFNNQEEIEASVKKFITSMNKNWYQRGIKELVERWFQTVEYDDLYFEYLAAFVVT